MSYLIYKIENEVNNKFYIGVTKSKYRFSSHKSNARKGRNLPLYNAMRKYGEDKFSFHVLEEGEDYEYGWKVREPYFIEKLNPDYNLTAGGDGVREYKHNKETIEKVRKKNIGRKRTEETKQRLREARLSYDLTEEWIENMSVAAKKRAETEEGRRQMGENFNSKKYTCSVCGKTMNGGNFRRWGHKL